jgi:hypothetical protein
MSQDTNDNDKIQQIGSQWAEVVGQLFDRMIGKDVSVTYNFENLVIDIPRAKAPGGRDMGSGLWTINGRIRITAEAHETSERAQQKASLSTTT